MNAHISNISSVMFVIRHESSPITALTALPPSTPVLIIDWHDSPWRIMTAAEALATRRHYADCGKLKTAVVAWDWTYDFNPGWQCLLNNDGTGYRLCADGRWDYIYQDTSMHWEEMYF